MLSEVPPPPHSQRKGIVPAVAQRHSKTVSPLLQQRHDVINGVEYALGVVRPGRLQNGISDAFSIQEDFIVTQACDIETCLFNGLLQQEFLPKQGCRINLVEFLFASGISFTVIDPAGGPIIFL